MFGPQHASKSSLNVSDADGNGANAVGLRRVLLLAFGSPSVTVEIHDPASADRLLQDLCARWAKSAQGLLDLAAGQKSALDDLRFIKELAKRLLKASHSSQEAQAARLLYHLAVAAGLNRFHIDMAGSQIADRFLLYERLGIVFSGHPIGDVFRRAADESLHVSERDSHA